MNPLCKHCEEKGIIKGGECVDHIIPIRLGGGHLMLSVKNLQTLCNSCHAIKSGKEAHKNLEQQ
jgi:5-methylcytosine-specific restriction protein A